MVFKKKKPIESFNAGVIEPEINPLSPGNVPRPPVMEAPPLPPGSPPDVDTLSRLDSEVKAMIEELQARFMDVYGTPPDSATAQRDETNTLLLALLTEQRKTNRVLEALLMKVA